MQCVEFEKHLQQLLDERIAPETDEQLAAHAESCPACRAVLEIQKRIMEVMSEPVAVRPADELSHAVLDRFTAHRKRARRRLATLALATAAALLIAVLPFVGDSPDLAQKNSKPNPKVVGLAIAPQPASSPWNEQDAEELRLLIRRVFDEISEHRREALEPVDRIASGLRPLTTTLNAAFAAIRQTLPGQEAHESEPPQAWTGHSTARVS